MKYRDTENLSDPDFRRLTGIGRDTFQRMAGILREADTLKKRRGGRKNSLSTDDMLLMTLEYHREYRTFFHMARDRGIGESTAWKNVAWVEDTLSGHPDFALPGRKSLTGDDPPCAVTVDVTEIPVERPKKNSVATTREKRNGTP